MRCGGVPQAVLQGLSGGSPGERSCWNTNVERGRFRRKRHQRTQVSDDADRVGAGWANALLLPLGHTTPLHASSDVKIAILCLTAVALPL
mmetsp:Transcript_127826/g.249167  ORF Transcript_127826/g.249167 Transcript_127826/m.249167 type:complete len:90 (+) Transcript_127826:267-536(+)